MASTIAAFDAHYYDSRGEKISLAGKTAHVRITPFTSDLTTVAIDSNSQFPATVISPSAGAEVRIRIPDDGFGRAGWLTRYTV